MQEKQIAQNPELKVWVTLSRSGTTGRFTNQSAPITVSSATYTVSGGSISVPVNNMNALDSYQLLITPASGAATWQKRYEAENATAVNANRFSWGSASNGGYVVRSTARRTAVHSRTVQGCENALIWNGGLRKSSCRHPWASMHQRVRSGRKPRSRHL